MEARVNYLIYFLQEPNNSSPANGEAKSMWGKPGFVQKVKEWANQ